MARHFKSESEDKRANLPLIEDGGLDDNTVASPALGFGMDRVDFLDERPPAAPTPDPLPQPRAFEQPAASAYEQEGVETLGRREVAAVSVDRSFYVSDVPSPYLTTKQANEDVQVTRRRHSRITAVVTIVLVLAVLGTGGWFVWNSLQSGPKAVVAQYETTEIEKGEYLEAIDATSLLRPANEVVVTSDVSGKVAEVYVENDADVQEGDLLFLLDNPTVDAAIDRARESLETFQHDVDVRQEALDKANEALTKAQEAVDKDDKDAAAKANLENARHGVEVAQNDLDAANNNLWSMQATYDQAAAQQMDLYVYAPISGKVSERVDAQSTVSGSTRLCVISDTSRLSIVMEIPSTEEGRVEVGQEVRLTFPDFEDLAAVSTVASLDVQDDKLLATVLIEQPDEHLTTGIAADASLVLKSIPDAFMVPVKALRTGEDGSTHLEVLLDSSRGIVTDVPVKVLATDGSRAAIEAENIQQGNLVVTE